MDDQFNSMKASAGTGGTIIGLICSCGCLAGLITYMVYLGIYAFNNPDPAACWVVEGTDATHGTIVDPTDGLTGD